MKTSELRQVTFVTGPVMARSFRVAKFPHKLKDIGSGCRNAKLGGVSVGYCAFYAKSRKLKSRIL